MHRLLWHTERDASESTGHGGHLRTPARAPNRGRPPRARWRRLVVAVVALVALGAGAWLAWSRISTPAVRTVAARAATPAGGGGGARVSPGGHATARPQAPPSAQNNRQGTAGPVQGSRREHACNPVTSLYLIPS